jgi:hypothetical protein
VFCGSVEIGKLASTLAVLLEAGLYNDKLIPWSDHPNCSCAVRDLCAQIIDSVRSPLQIFAARELFSSAHLQHELVLWGLRILTYQFQRKMVWIRFCFWHKICPGQTTPITRGVWRSFGRNQGKNIDQQSKRKTEVWSSDWWLVEALHFVILLQSWVIQVCM